MIIKSQEGLSKKRVIILENVTSITVEKNQYTQEWEFFYHTTSDSDRGGLIGTYPSKDRADEVLEELCDLYEGQRSKLGGTLYQMPVQ